MELHQLRALVFVAETGSVSEAARRLLLTQPAVTRQIHALEEELGGVLFDRTTKPLTPTALGKAALEHARRILQMSEDLRALVSSEAGTLRGELRLGVVPTLARQVIVPVVLGLRREYPEIQLRLTGNWSGALRREVEDGLLDAALLLVLSHTHVPAGFAATRIAPEPVTLLSSTKTSLKGTVPLQALRRSEWVLSREGCGYRALLKRTLEEAGIPLTVAVELLDTDLQLELIREGVGLGIIPVRALPPRLERTGLQTFSVAGITFSLEVWLFHRRTGPVVPAAMPVIEHIVSSLLLRGAAARRRRGGARHNTHYDA